MGTQALMAAATLLASLGMSIANTALPAITEGLSITVAEGRWVIVAYLAAVTITAVLAGRLGDRFGRERLFAGGLALFALASLVCALAPGLPLLVAARAAQGAGAAVALTLSQALLAAWAPADRLGRAMGLLGTMSAAGTALGPSLGGFLVQGAGWRAVFLFLAAFAAASLVLAGRVLSLSRDANRAAAERALPGKQLLLAQPGLAAGLLTNMIVSAVMMATLVVGPFYLSAAEGLSPARIGLVMSVGPLLSILSGIPAGRLVDKLGRREAAALGLGIMVASAVGLATLPALFGLGGYVGALMLLSPGYQLFLAGNGASMMGSVAPAMKGTVSGLLALSRNLGLLGGAALMGALYAAHGFRATFLAAALLVTLALAIAVAGRLRARAATALAAAPCR